MTGRFKAPSVRKWVATVGEGVAPSHPYVSKSSANSHLGAMATWVRVRVRAKFRVRVRVGVRVRVRASETTYLHTNLQETRMYGYVVRKVYATGYVDSDPIILTTFLRLGLGLGVRVIHGHLVQRITVVARHGTQRAPAAAVGGREAKR